LGAIETAEWFVRSRADDATMKAWPLIVLADRGNCEFGVSECFRKTWDWDFFALGGWPSRAPRQAPSKHPNVISKVCSREWHSTQIAQCCGRIKRRNNPAASFRNEAYWSEVDLSRRVHRRNDGFANHWH
jgi:hypothetical protein